MKGNLIKAIAVIFCISFMPLGTVRDGRAEDAEATSVPTIGGMQWGGSIELGYRFVGIDANKNRYREVVNLSDGLRLFDFSLLGNSPDKKGLADTVRLNFNSIGDPFPSALLDIKKSKTYELTATYRQYKYFFDRTDNDFLTDNHNFDQTTRRGSLALSIFPKEDIRITFGYNHTRRDGDAVVPRPFIEAQEQDLNERYNEYFVAGDFSVANIDVHARQSYWSFDNKDEIHGPDLTEIRDEHVGTYVSTIKGHSQLGERWDVDAGYTYARSGGHADLLSDPVSFVDPGRNKFNFNTHIAELGVSFALRKQILLHVDYRFHIENKEGFPTNDPDIHHTELDITAHTGSFQVEYIPRDNLTLRAGYRVQFRDVDWDPGEGLELGASTGGKHPTDTDTLAHGWIASGDWKPYKSLSFSGEYQGAAFDNPYTRISPQRDTFAKLRIKYDTPLKNLSLMGTARWSRKVNPDQTYSADTKDYMISAVYQPSYLAGLTFDGSFTLEKVKSNKEITNEDVTPVGLNRFSFNSDAFIYQAGLNYEGIIGGLGGRLFGSYAKTRKEDSQNYADGGLSLWYKNKWVTPMVTVERTYLVDKVNRADSFDANLLTLSLRKDF